MKEVDPKSEKGKKALEQEVATASVTGVRRAWNDDSIARGLNPSKLANVLASANRGDIYDFLTLAEEMEEREPHYGSVLRTRKLAIEGLERHVEPANDDEQSKKIADDINNLVQSAEFDDLISALVDGLGKGFAACEVMWKGFKTTSYVWRDPRYFRFSDDDAYTLRLCNEDGTAGDHLPAYKFVVHQPKLKAGIPIRGGLARMAALSYMCKTYALTDWMAFCEVFGMPIRVGKYGNGASNEDKAILRRAVANIGTDAAAIIPESMQLEFIQAANAKGGESLFENLANWLDKQISKAVLGQTMTADDGSSNAQSQVHNEVRLDLLKADAKQLTTTINQQLIKPYIDFNYGVQEVYPKFALYVAEPEDIAALVDGVHKLVPLGFKVPQQFLRDKLGIPDPNDDDELLGVASVEEPVNEPTKPSDKVEANSKTELNSNHAHHHDHPHDDEDGLDDFVNVSEAAIKDLVAKLHTANSFDEMLTMLNSAELNTSDIADVLALSGIKAFADGTVQP
ncbi:DUF935 domain-containing protein [Psychrobacter sp. HD31]|uniref:DUF935 domain-containing protein n=1 Tax=Psychrobacter sp. HD31 TaxID=3112003 RepID=UPI003DA525D3